MLSLKALLTKILQSLVNMQTVITHGSGVYASQNYVTETAFNRIKLYQFAGTRMGFLAFNLQIASTIPESTFITIGTLPVTPSISVSYIAPPQMSGKGNLLVSISDEDGTVKIYAHTSGYSYTGFYRAVIPVILPYAES